MVRVRVRVRVRARATARARGRHSSATSAYLARIDSADSIGTG